MIFGRKRRERQGEQIVEQLPEEFPEQTAGQLPENFLEQTAGQGRVPDSAAAESALDAVSRPRVIFSAARSGPTELTSQLPLRGELAGVIPGPDRPDYCLVVLDRPIAFEPPEDFDRDRIRQSAIDQMALDLDDVLPIGTLVVAARQTGIQISPTMVDLVVNIAYVLDESVLTDELLEFDKVHFVAIATLNLE